MLKKRGIDDDFGGLPDDEVDDLGEEEGEDLYGDDLDDDDEFDDDDELDDLDEDDDLAGDDFGEDAVLGGDEEDEA